MNNVTFTLNGVVYTVYTIPTQGTAQIFTTSLAGVTYTLKLQWCAPAGCWILQIGDSQYNPVAAGIPLLTGADLLEQLGYLGIGGSMLVQSTNDPDEVPGYSELGSTGELYFVVPALTL